MPVWFLPIFADLFNAHGTLVCENIRVRSPKQEIWTNSGIAHGWFDVIQSRVAKIGMIEWSKAGDDIGLACIAQLSIDNSLITPKMDMVSANGIAMKMSAVRLNVVTA
jgi:hypothetical protein